MLDTYLQVFKDPTTIAAAAIAFMVVNSGAMLLLGIWLERQRATFITKAACDACHKATDDEHHTKISEVLEGLKAFRLEIRDDIKRLFEGQDDLGKKIARLEGSNEQISAQLNINKR